MPDPPEALIVVDDEHGAVDQQTPDMERGYGTNAPEGGGCW